MRLINGSGSNIQSGFNLHTVPPVEDIRGAGAKHVVVPAQAAGSQCRNALKLTATLESSSSYIRFKRAFNPGSTWAEPAR